MPDAAMRYQPRNFWTRRRLKLMTLGVLILPVWSWFNGSAQWAHWAFAPGVLLVAFGLGWRLWAAGWLHKHQELCTGGPYALVRHPLYLGSGLIACGQGLMSAVPLAALLFPALWLLLHRAALSEEEQFLREKYGARYGEYQQKVPALWPRPASTLNALRATGNTARFSWLQAARNREYEAILVNIVAIAIFAFLNSRR